MPANKQLNLLNASAARLIKDGEIDAEEYAKGYTAFQQGRVSLRADGNIEVQGERGAIWVVVNSQDENKLAVNGWMCSCPRNLRAFMNQERRACAGPCKHVAIAAALDDAGDLADFINTEVVAAVTMTVNA